MPTTQPIKVMQIITRMVRGGAQLVVLDLLKSLDRDRFQVMLVSGAETGDEGSLWPQIQQLGIPTVKVKELVRPVAPWQDWRALRKIRRLIAHCRPDIVHAHTSKAGYIGCQAAAKESVSGIVLSPHGHILGPASQIPGVPARGLKRHVLAHLARQSARRAHAVVAPNEVERLDGIQRQMWTPEQCVTVPNGIDTARFQPAAREATRRMLEWPLDTSIIGVVARLTREKGVDVAIASLPRLPGVELSIVGDGPERSQLERQAQALGVADRVTFHGVQSDIERLLPAFDVLLIPSRTEAHGMVAAEGLACSVPVVASAVGGLQSLVEDEKTGLLVPPDDPRELASAVRQLLLDNALARSLACQGREHIVDHFSQQQMIHKTEQMYLNVLRRDPTQPQS